MHAIKLTITGLVPVKVFNVLMSVIISFQEMTHPGIKIKSRLQRQKSYLPMATRWPCMRWVDKLEVFGSNIFISLIQIDMQDIYTYNSNLWDWNESLELIDILSQCEIN